jgi:hypothetical protein
MLNNLEIGLTKLLKSGFFLSRFPETGWDKEAAGGE